MRVPDLYWARDLKEWSVDARTGYGVNYMARPIGYQGLLLFRRMRIAWLVFTGKCDAVRWSELP